MIIITIIIMIMIMIIINYTYIYIYMSLSLSLYIYIYIYIYAIAALEPWEKRGGDNGGGIYWGGHIKILDCTTEGGLGGRGMRRPAAVDRARGL